jgi:hypothetical protein
MLYKIDYTTRNERAVGSKWMNNVADKTEAVTRFMDNFFVTHPGDAVRIELITRVDLIGDLSRLDVIDAATK